MFNPEAFSDIDAIRAGLSAPYLVIRNALVPEIAEKLYTSLHGFADFDSEDESIFKGRTPEGYRYNRLSLGMASNRAPAEVRSLNAYLNSNEILKLMQSISNRACSEFAGNIAVFKEGHYIQRHNDMYSENRTKTNVLSRSITFNYFLTRDWRPEWGGQFVWENPKNVINPEFNTLVMFLVGPDSHHHVTEVRGNGDNDRIALTGWFYTHRDAESYNLSMNLDFL